MAYFCTDYSSKDVDIIQNIRNNPETFYGGKVTQDEYESTMALLYEQERGNK